MNTASPENTGLDGIVAAETMLSQVDGRAGRLIVRGRDIEEIAGTHDFADMAALLWDGLTPEALSPGEIRRELGRARQAAAHLLPNLLPAAAGLPPIEGLRAGLALLSDADCDHHLICAAVPVFTAALWRQKQGQGPIAPNPDHGQAEDFLAMLRGDAANTATDTGDTAAAKALETYLVTVADHGLNASTFTALALEAVGLPRELFTLAFAMGRVLGWTAHIFEQEQSGRLIRPASRYTGLLPDGRMATAIAG